MILIHPPVAKLCEPPAGIARLCGAMDYHGIRNTVLDANLEGLLHLLKSSPGSPDTWTSRALRHLHGHLDSLKSWDAYRNEDRYRRAIKDLNRLLEMTSHSSRVRISLANYQHEELSPARSGDLIKSAEHPEENPFYPYFRKRLTGLLRNEQPPLIGFSLNYLSQALCTFAMIGFLKREWPGIQLILGGGLVTSWMRRPHWQNPFEGLVDHLVAGPGEVPLLLLMGVHPVRNSGGALNPPGIILKCDPPAGQWDIISNGVKGLNGCSERGFGNDHYRPSYDSFPLKDYFAPGPILPYSASSGCYWNRCSFCPERAEGNPYLVIPVEEVISDLHGLVERHQPVLIHFLDNAISPSLLKAICEHPPGVPWYGFVRITRHLTDLDFCLALKRSGCVMLKLGLESGDQTVLDNLQKGIHLEEVSSVLRNLKKAGIAAYVYLLFGTPPEGLIEARRTLEFVAKHYDCIGFLNLAIFNMPIYGPEAQEMETKQFYEGDLSLYTSFNHPKGWGRPLIRQFLDKEFKRHPAIASIVRRDPPVFTSNHAPFFFADLRNSPIMGSET
ncbi:MAG: radical SAM protein [Deltaproteobacteria bacterium RBG_16_49_23]|nr:MAG: radical SAM protein [Deltaproteobacteria bacterium RBG_16_49_23]